MFSCGLTGCSALIAMHKQQHERVQNKPDEWFYCSAGHHIHYSGPGPQERQHQAALAAERQRREAEERRRAEAEQRAAQQEEAALIFKRERNEARRTLRRSLKVAENAVKAKGARK